MARHSVGARATGAGSSSLPLGSLYAGSGSGGQLRELGIFNTTATVAAVRLVRLVTLATVGTGLTEAAHNDNLALPECLAFDTHTGGTPIGADLGYRAAIGAAVGSGIVWTFGEDGIVIPKGVNNGIGIVPVGTGTIYDWYAVWDE